MRNQAFRAQTEVAARRKLEAVLRRLTSDQLTAWQRRLIAQAAGCRRQYSIQLCQDLEPFLDASDTGYGAAAVRHIFGDAGRRPDRPAAVLIQRFAWGKSTHTVYIYLPTGEGGTAG